MEDGAKIHVSSNIKNTHLQEIFQIKSAAVTRLTGIESFPKLKTIQARYPRDLVLNGSNKFNLG
ncbi:hypothetical protein PO124_27945 [Bacillus licheniformis]|nr:hypothetical protein [Bacillus licheniformis]